MLVKTTKAVTKAIIDAGKLTFAGKHFSKNALQKNDSVAWTIADTIKQDRGAAVQLISDTMKAMDSAGMKGEPRRIVKVSICRAVSVLHDRMIDVKVTERPELTITITDKVKASSWVEENASMLKKLGAVMEDYGLSFYDVGAGVASLNEKTIEASAVKTNTDAEKALEAESVRTYESGILDEVLAANG